MSLSVTSELRKFIFVTSDLLEVIPDVEKFNLVLHLIIGMSSSVQINIRFLTYHRFLSTSIFALIQTQIIKHPQSNFTFFYISNYLLQLVIFRLALKCSSILLLGTIYLFFVHFVLTQRRCLFVLWCLALRFQHAFSATNDKGRILNKPLNIHTHYNYPLFFTTQRQSGEICSGRIKQRKTMCKITLEKSNPTQIAKHQKMNDKINILKDGNPNQQILLEYQTAKKKFPITIITSLQHFCLVDWQTNLHLYSYCQVGAKIMI